MYTLCTFRLTSIHNEIQLQYDKQMLSMFGSAYICEQTFLLTQFQNSKYVLRLTDGHLIAGSSIFTTNVKPMINKLMDAIRF